MPDPTPERATERAPRFHGKVGPVDANGCRRWLGAHDRLGYGTLNIGNNSVVGAHRFAWIVANGPIPKGVAVLHACDVRDCVELAHLRLGTARDNTADMDARGRRPMLLPRRA